MTQLELFGENDDRLYQVWLNTSAQPGGRIKQGQASTYRAAHNRARLLRSLLPAGSSDWYTVDVVA